jgi:hypothetical protein
MFGKRQTREFPGLLRILVTWQLAIQTSATNGFTQQKQLISNNKKSINSSMPATYPEYLF